MSRTSTVNRAARRKLQVRKVALAEFGCLIRPDWCRRDLDGVIHDELSGLEADGQEARDRFASLVLRVARLAGVDDSAAFDLRKDSWTPDAPRSGPPADPESVPAAAEMLAAAHAAIAGRKTGGTP